MYLNFLVQNHVEGVPVFKMGLDENKIFWFVSIFKRKD